MTSIRWNLSLRLLIGLSLVLGLGAIALYAEVRSGLIAQFDASLRAKALALSELSETDDEEFEERSELLDEFERSDHPSYFELWGPNGALRRRSRSLGESDLPRLELEGQGSRTDDVILPDGLAGRAVAVRSDYENHGETTSRAQTSVARDLGEVDRVLGVLSWSLVGAWLATLILAGLLVKLTLARGLAPLDEFAARASRIEPESLDARFELAHLPAELAPIGSRLNDLLERLQRAFERERRFNAAVAHELRTPIAELRSACEVALRYPDAGGESTVRDALDVALQMERLVTSLLTLRRVESGEALLARETFDLGLVVREAWRRVESSARSKSIDRVDHGLHELAIESDRTLVASVIGNLVSNAVEYAPANSRIEGSLEFDGDRFRFVVINAARELSNDDLEHLFEPFWRKDTARTSSDHFGLGLSLARAIARALDLEVRASRLDSERISFELSGPSRRSS